MRLRLTVLVLLNGAVAPAMSLSAQAPVRGPVSQLVKAGTSSTAEIETRSLDNATASSNPLPADAVLHVSPARDSATTYTSNRHLHMLIGGAAGAVVGWMVGRAGDHGRSGCGTNGQSGQTCDWTSGYEEPAGALLGMLLGIGIGALWPHD